MAILSRIMRFRWRTGAKPVRSARGQFHAADRFLVCFFAGLLVGTAAANLFYPSLSDQAAYYLSLLEYNTVSGREAQLRLFGQIFRQRLIEVFIAWLIGLTAYAVPCFCLLSGGFGLSVGVVLSMMTGQKGLLGLPFFVTSVMPQAFFYVPAWCLLMLWGIRRGERLRIFALVLLLLFVAAGCASEVWLNPWFMSLAGS